MDTMVGSFRETLLSVQWSVDLKGFYCMYVRMYVFRPYVCMRVYSKTSLNRPTMGPAFNGPFREMVSFGS